MVAKRGQPQHYGEKKSSVICAELTPTARLLLDQKITAYDGGLSRQEFLERLGRGVLDRDRFLAVFFAEMD